MLNKITEIVGDSLPSIVYPYVYSMYTRIHPDRDLVKFKREGNCYRCINKRTDENIYVHKAEYLYRIQSEGMESFHHRLLDKYTLDGFAEINEGDVVIDVGAHIGGFSLSAAKRAVHVYAIEPDPRVQESLGRTVETHNNISVHQTALNNSSDQAEFLLGKNPSENSLINVDTGEELQSITVSCNTIEDFVELIYHDSIDFLKLDAGGAEPEVIRGFGEIRPTMVAIDAGPERKQKSTRDTVQRLLESMEYETRVEYNIVFARQIN